MIQINIKELAEIKATLSELRKLILEKERAAKETILDNKGLMEYLKISATKAQKHWRNKTVWGFLFWFNTIE